MFFKKCETQSQMEKQPIEQYIGCLHKESKERQMVAEENKPDSPCGKIYLSWYPNNLEESAKIAYSIMSYDCDVFDNSWDFFCRFNRIAADIACKICKDYTTAILLTCPIGMEEHSFHLDKYAEKKMQEPQGNTRFFHYPFYALLRIGKGADYEMLEAYYHDRSKDVNASLSYSCFAMRDGFFESCPDSFFEFNQLSDIEKVRKFLSQFNHVVWQQDMGFDHNDQQITVDRRFISHERVVEIVRQSCEKEDMPLHINDK